MVQLIFTPDDSGTNRASGYATVSYSSDSKDETVFGTTEDYLASVFKTAKEDGETLDGTEKNIENATDNPLDFRDYLILDSNGAIVFDTEYTRKSTDQTQA